MKFETFPFHCILFCVVFQFATLNSSSYATLYRPSSMGSIQYNTDCKSHSRQQPDGWNFPMNSSQRLSYQNDSKENGFYYF